MAVNPIDSVLKKMSNNLNNCIFLKKKLNKHLNSTISKNTIILIKCKTIWRLMYKIIDLKYGLIFVQ